MIVETKPANPWLYVGLVIGLVGVVYSLVKNEINDDAKVESLNMKIDTLSEQLANVPTIYDDTVDAQPETSQPEQVADATEEG